MVFFIFDSCEPLILKDFEKEHLHTSEHEYRLVGETGDGRYKIYILHHISLMKKLLHSILGLPLAHYLYYNLKHTKHENIN